VLTILALILLYSYHIHLLSYNIIWIKFAANISKRFIHQSFIRCFHIWCQYYRIHWPKCILLHAHWSGGHTF
jgi:hypothetical protein